MHSPPLSDRHPNSPSSSVARRYGTKPQLCTPIISAVLTLCQSLNWAASSATLYNGVCIHPLSAPPLNPFTFLPNGPGPLSPFLFINLDFLVLAERVPNTLFAGQFLRQASIGQSIIQSLLTSMIINSILLTLLPGLAIATNDWSKPCTSGSCSYESGDGINTAWSNLVIVRSPCGTPFRPSPLIRMPLLPTP